MFSSWGFSAAQRLLQLFTLIPPLSTELAVSRRPKMVSAPTYSKSDPQGVGVYDYYVLILTLPTVEAGELKFLPPGTNYLLGARRVTGKIIYYAGHVLA